MAESAPDPSIADSVDKALDVAMRNGFTRFYTLDRLVKSISKVMEGR